MNIYGCVKNTEKGAGDLRRLLTLSPAIIIGGSIQIHEKPRI